MDIATSDRPEPSKSGLIVAPFSAVGGAGEDALTGIIDRVLTVARAIGVTGRGEHVLRGGDVGF